MNTIIHINVYTTRIEHFPCTNRYLHIYINENSWFHIDFKLVFRPILHTFNYNEIFIMQELIYNFNDIL